MKITDLKTMPKSNIDDILSQLYWSDNEEFVITCTLKGYSIIQIANKLWVSPRTVNRIKKSINTKLQGISI